MIVKQETKHKRNETKQAETKRNETKKTKKTSMNKKTKQTLTKRFFFYMRQQSTKYQWRIEKPLKFMGRFGYGRKI